MKCPSCGAVLTFNIKTQLLDCEYCSSSFNVKEYHQNNQGTKGSSLDTYLCNNCGAELDAPHEQIVSYCMYCGGEVSLLNKSEKSEQPQNIIPFKCAKDYAKKEYARYVAKQHFVPKEFKDPEFLEGFRGIFIPYWHTNASIENSQAILSGKKESYEDGYDYTRYYDYNVLLQGKIDGGNYDASAALDDTVASVIAPFHKSNMVPFNEGYLAGFYADKATAPFKNYEDTIKEKAYSNISKQIEYITEGVKTDDSSLKENISLKVEKPSTSLFPLWFLTWRKKDRVAYSIMNGETGKMTAEFPVDYKKFFAFGILLAVVLFGILSLLPFYVSPISMATLSSYFLYFSSLILIKELRNIYDRENHIHDLGNRKLFSKEKLKPKDKASCLGCSSKLISFIILLLFFIAGFRTSDPGVIPGVFFIMTIFQTITLFKALKTVKGITNKIAIITFIANIIIQFGAIFFSGENKPHDFWYLGISIACMTGMILNIITSILYMNYMFTRPVPNFYTRKGANNELK